MMTPTNMRMPLEACRDVERIADELRRVYDRLPDYTQDEISCQCAYFTNGGMRADIAFVTAMTNAGCGLEGYGESVQKN